MNNKEEQLARTDYGARFNDGKLQWTLVDMDAFAPMVKVLMFGAKKYSPHNWKKGFNYTDILNSMQRHINAFLAGEDNDPESGLPHIGHIQCNAMFLGYMTQFKQDLDDRYADPNKQEKPAPYAPMEPFFIKDIGPKVALPITHLTD